MLDILSLNYFEKFMNQAFLIHFEKEKSLEAKLVRLEKLNGESNLKRSPFSITFETRQKDHFYSQAIYKVSHPDLEDLHLFMVPSGKSKNGMLYEVTFS